MLGMLYICNKMLRDFLFNMMIFIFKGYKKARSG